MACQASSKGSTIMASVALSVITSRTRTENGPLLPRDMTKPKVLSRPRMVLASDWRCETS